MHFGANGWIMNTPDDYKDPRWDEYDKVHCWRNYVSEDLIAIWDEFTDDQKSIIATDFQAIADNEDWD